MDRRMDATRGELHLALALEVRPLSSNTIMSLARASDQWMPKGRIRNWSSRPGSVTVKVVVDAFLELVQRSPCEAQAASWTFASWTGSMRCLPMGRTADMVRSSPFRRHFTLQASCARPAD
jgi:hypothetical protein